MAIKIIYPESSKKRGIDFECKRIKFSIFSSLSNN
jgi:hypothetical protein